MDAIEILIADSLADSLSKAAYSGSIGSITATRRFVPDFDAADMDTLHVSVVPGSVDVTAITHGSDLFEIETHVVLGQRISGNDDVDDLIDLRSQIVDKIRSKALPESSPAMPDGVVWFSISNEVTFEKDALTNMRVYLCDIAVVHRRSQGKVT